MSAHQPNVINLSKQYSILHEWIYEIRSVDVQTDRMRFRKNLERIAEVAAYEISKHLPYVKKLCTTPLGNTHCWVLEQQPVIATILRAGLAMHQGLLNYFDKADNAFVSAYRKHHDDGSFEISLEYLSCPSLEGRYLIICDPMLATGSSLVKAIQFLLECGQPIQIHVIAAIACTVGIDYLHKHFPQTVVWAGDIDEELTARGYIVPGLGDAGDLAYGGKQQQ
ncbi:MAG: uracil phosphoribosyltransferase [Thermoflavifilum sp.]|nr:uracil phosphoribosyltransferase [Thermoflavifilum sp.]